jgi:hypothetical protein
VRPAVLSAVGAVVLLGLGKALAIVGRRFPAGGALKHSSVANCAAKLANRSASTSFSSCSCITGAARPTKSDTVAVLRCTHLDFLAAAGDRRFLPRPSLSRPPRFFCSLRSWFGPFLASRHVSLHSRNVSRRPSTASRLLFKLASGPARAVQVPAPPERLPSCPGRFCASCTVGQRSTNVSNSEIANTNSSERRLPRLIRLLGRGESPRPFHARPPVKSPRPSSADDHRRGFLWRACPLGVRFKRRRRGFQSRSRTHGVP